MAWRNAIASIVLAEEINLRWPNRDKASDGTIGDAAHQSRKSDHNPWVKDRNGIGVVRARDIDEDLDGNRKDSGRDLQPIFERLLTLAKAGDPRINGGGYIIYEGRIHSERQNWASRPYSGTSNPHTKHLHLSLSLNASGYDSDKPWGLLTPSTPKFQNLKVGSRGANVANLAVLLNTCAKAEYTMGIDFKPRTSQLKVPRDSAGRNNFVFDKKVEQKLRQFQFFARFCWMLGGKKGPEIVTDGIYGPITHSAMQFWAPLAIQKVY